MYINSPLPLQNRVVRQNPGERNYHIFYAILAGTNNQQRGEWGRNTIISFNKHLSRKVNTRSYESVQTDFRHRKSRKLTWFKRVVDVVISVFVCLQRRSGWPILTAITTWDSPAARTTRQSTTRALFRMFWCAWLCCIYWFKAQSNSYLQFTVCAVFQNIWFWSNLKCGKHLDCSYFSFSLIVWHKWYFCMVLVIHNHE